MKIKQTIIFLVSLLVSMNVMAEEATTDSVAQGESQLATDITASLIIAEPANDLYGGFGHCAIRMQCPSHDMDYCFSYSLEYTLKNQFDFFNGTGRGVFQPMATSDFLMEYDGTHRGVKEYVLNLNLDEKRLLWQRLDENVKNGPSTKYNYLTTNCSSMCVLTIYQAMQNESIMYGELPPELTGTYRDFVIGEGEPGSWSQLFWTTILGAMGDEYGNLETKLSPRWVTKVWGKSKIVNDSTKEMRPVFLGEPKALYDDHLEIPPTVITPVLVFSILIFLSLLFSVLQLRGKCRKAVRTYDIVLLIGQTLAGLVVFYMCFLSQHESAHYNPQVIALNPLPLIGFLVALKKPNAKFGFALCYTLMLVAYLVVSIFNPQTMLAHVLGAVALLIRSAVIAYCERKRMRQVENS
ncbi:MAG: DUF4105 domain-containing protein [Prevotellaceae bacterium]|nr:DUF4105 domain-containing protein [Prevotellaceae bacterium]